MSTVFSVSLNNVEISVIPAQFLRNEVSGDSTDFERDLREIYWYYNIYQNGVSFKPDSIPVDEKDFGQNFSPSTLSYKLATSLIDKQARFLFAEPPDIVIEGKENDTGIAELQEYLQAVLEDNNFEDAILKAAKDCFVGKRVSVLANFDTASGVTVSFIPSTQFVFERSKINPRALSKYVSFAKIYTADSVLIFKKKYTLERGVVFLEETLHSLTGEPVQVLTEKSATALTMIPAVVIVNDGLTGDVTGESEIGRLVDYEEAYSKLSNADMDAGRFSMNPVTVISDASSESTKGLKRRPGEVWDVVTNPDQDTNRVVPVGTKILEASMNYSVPLKTTLERIKATAYETIDMPNVTLESMTGVITSGKSLKAIYWSLITRCKEKMKSWSPALRNLVRILVDGGRAYPATLTGVYAGSLPDVPFSVRVVQNHSLPEDDVEEMGIDLQNVEAKTMSRKAFMKKWRGLTDTQVDEELQQIANENEMLESTFSPPITGGVPADFGDDGGTEPNVEPAGDDTADENPENALS